MTDDHMNDQPNDAIQDERIRSLAAGHYNAPDGTVPRDAMWAQISAARRAARAGVAPMANVAPAADVVEETPTEVPLDAIPGYDEETRLQYAGGLPEDTGEESLAE